MGMVDAQGQFDDISAFPALLFILRLFVDFIIKRSFL